MIQGFYNLFFGLVKKKSQDTIAGGLTLIAIVIYGTFVVGIAMILVIVNIYDVFKNEWFKIFLLVTSFAMGIICYFHFVNEGKHNVYHRRYLELANKSFLKGVGILILTLTILLPLIIPIVVGLSKD